MTLAEASAKANRLRALGGLWACVTRILPETVDPPDPADNGWDVHVTVTVETLEDEQ